jgi:hypothetical protein
MLLLCGIEVEAINVRVTTRANADGVYSTAFPCVLADRSDCAPPTTGTLTCSDAAAPALTGLSTGSAYSADVRQFFGGSAAATATLTVVTVSGDNAATNGWAISSAGAGNNLTNAGSNAGAGALKVRGTTSGNSVDCSTRNWSFAAPPAGETVAPTIPTGLAYTPGSNSVTITGDAPSDPPPSASRVKQINLRFNGTGGTTTVSVGQGLSRALTQQIIGSSDGTPASTQTGTALSLGFGGAGVDSTADQILAFTDATGIAGDAFATVTISSITSAASFPKAGIRVAESNAVGAKAVYCYVQNSATKKVQCKTRATDGVTTASQLSQTVTGTLSLRLTRTVATNSWQFDYSTDSGVTWTAGATFTLSMASTVYWGTFITSTTAATNATASLTNWNLNNVARWSYAKTTASTVTIDATSQDVNDNLSAYSGSISATPNAVPLKKWHPGHYMQITRGNADLVQSTRFGYYDAIASDTHVIGVVVPFRWSQLEGASAGDYAAGIATIQAEVNKLKGLAVPKRLFIRLMDFHYGGSGGVSNYFPAYVSGTYTYQGTNGVGWCRWDSTAMDHYIAMLSAYAAAFDDEPYFEGLYLNRESAAALGSTTPCGYTGAAYDSSYRRMVAAEVAVFKKSNVIESINYLVSQSTTNSHIAYLSSVQAGMGGPDVLPTACTTQTPYAYNTLTGTSGGHDYRSEIPVLYSVEASEMGGVLGNCTIDQLRDYANDTLQASHVFWDRNTFSGSASQQWSGGILPYIQTGANALTHTSCPSIYTQGCDTN